jgi:CheY-like chemotaxis protein
MTARILVLDDNMANRALAVTVLERAGYDVIEAENAEQAQALVLPDPPDLMLVDIGLPGMDGLAFTRSIKARPELRHVPVIAVTAHAMRGDEEKAIAAGCNAYVTKPIDVRKLPELVAQLLRDAPGR